MYKILTSLWAKSPTSTKQNTHLTSIKSSDLSVDEDGWVLVSDNVSKTAPLNHDNSSIMTNSWIASPPLIRTDESTIINRSSSPPPTHHFNPIENLLIEHASMSVYEQIASNTRSKRQRKAVQPNLLDEQVEDDGDDDDDDRSSVVLQYQSQHPNLSSIHHRNLNVSISHSTTSSISPLESSTSSLAAHQRHLHRIHQRRRRSAKPSSKLALANNIDETKQQTSSKIIERQRLNYSRTPKIMLHQPSRSNH